MQRVVCPACQGSKEYPHAGNKCMCCDGVGYVEIGVTTLMQMELIEKYKQKGEWRN